MGISFVLNSLSSVLNELLFSFNYYVWVNVTVVLFVCCTVFSYYFWLLLLFMVFLHLYISLEHIVNDYVYDSQVFALMSFSIFVVLMYFGFFVLSSFVYLF